jgi:aspartate 1-decarboxylase
MLRPFLRAMIHRACVTRCNTSAPDSVTIDRDLLEASDLLALEVVNVENVTRGTRFTTHCLLGPPGSGELAVNGAPAALADAGDVVTISAYCHLDREDVPRHRARTLFVDERNRIVALREQTPFAPPDDEA